MHEYTAVKECSAEHGSLPYGPRCLLPSKVHLLLSRNVHDRRCEQASHLSQRLDRRKGGSGRGRGTLP